MLHSRFSILGEDEKYTKNKIQRLNEKLKKLKESRHFERRHRLYVNAFNHKKNDNTSAMGSFEYFDMNESFLYRRVNKRSCSYRIWGIVKKLWKCNLQMPNNGTFPDIFVISFHSHIEFTTYHMECNEEWTDERWNSLFMSFSVAE